MMQRSRECNESDDLKFLFGKGAARGLEGGGDATLSGERSDGRRAGGEQERLDGGVGVSVAAARAVQRRAAVSGPRVYEGLRGHKKAQILGRPY
mgnify:CR=1 FL=1